MQVVHYTDPGCPFAYSAEPQRWQLRWHYGEQLQWRTVLVGLAETGAVYEAKGFTTDKLAAGQTAIAAKYGMPIDTSERERMSGTVTACRAVVAARVHADEDAAEALLRRLRIETMGGALLDDDATIARAAGDAGLDADALATWMQDAAVEEALRADMRDARAPSAAALLLNHKLAPSEDGGRRYTCPSYEFGAGAQTLVAPGYQPWETYDAMVANLAPGLTRRDAPSGVEEILAWAGEPLATVEIAALLGVDREDARAKLEAAGATFTALGTDGFWVA